MPERALLQLLQFQRNAGSKRDEIRPLCHAKEKTHLDAESVYWLWSHQETNLSPNDAQILTTTVKSNCASSTCAQIHGNKQVRPTPILTDHRQDGILKRAVLKSTIHHVFVTTGDVTVELVLYHFVQMRSQHTPPPLCLQIEEILVD